MARKAISTSSVMPAATGKQHEVGQRGAYQELLFGTAQPAKVKPVKSRLPLASANSRSTPLRSRRDGLNSRV